MRRHSIIAFVFGLIYLSFTPSYLRSLDNSPEFVIFTGSYNNSRWIKKYFQSLQLQNYPRWSCIYVNDASTDDTLIQAREIIQRLGLHEKVRLIDNSERQGLVANMNRHIRSIDERKVVIILDGDDALAHGRVLEKLSKVYANKNVWMSYGNYVPEPKKRGHRSLCRRFPQKILKNNLFRKYKWVSSHLKTFYARLFHLIDEKDLQEKDGRFFQIAGDLAIMFPMLEMSSRGHIRFISDVLLKYNTENPASDYFKLLELERVSRYIVHMPAYTPIEGNLFP